MWVSSEKVYESRAGAASPLSVVSAAGVSRASAGFNFETGGDEVSEAAVGSSALSSAASMSASALRGVSG